MSRQQRPRRTLRQALGLCACGLLLVTTGGPLARAQGFPSTPPVPVMFDDYESTTAPRPPDDPLDGTGVIWDEWTDPPGSSTDFTYYPTSVPPQVRGGLWGARCIWEGLVSRGWNGYLVAQQSKPGHPSYVPADWTNLRIDVDLTVTRYGIPGIVWGVHDPDADGIPDQGYLFLLRDFPTLEQAVVDGRRAGWEVYRIDAENSRTLVASGSVDVPSSDDYTRYMVYYRAFRLRLEWYCGNLRVRMQRIYDPETTTVPRYYGCGSSCPSTNDEDCWCTMAEWTDAGTSLTPGAAGLYHTGVRRGSGTNVTQWDNFSVSAWNATCSMGCDPWSAWTQTSSELIPFKLLYESGLVDYSAGRNVSERKIDIATTAPADTSPNNSRTTNYCNGWNLLVDLPAPGVPTDTDDIRAFLQPMATAVDYVADGGGSFSWQDTFDNDPDSPTYNPVPMVADGATPINNSLLDAFDWYVNQVTGEGDWANDPLADCRQWYVVLITDGAESCADPGQYACDPGQAADQLSNPNIAGVNPLPVFTIGFSEAVADAPQQLTCISDQTSGLYYGARNASELSDALYDVFYTLQTDARSFTGFKITPPSSAPDSQAEGARDALVAYPIFQPAPQRSLWRGDLFGFVFNNVEQPIPTTANCEVDFSQVVREEMSGNRWDANQRLAEQLAIHDESSPARYVFMGSDATGSWARHDLATIPTNHTLRLELQNLLNVSGGITNLRTQEVVNFVRGVWMDDDTSASPDPDPSPRPAGYSALGDIYHSKPVVVRPPAKAMYFFDYGFGVSGEQGAHDYRLFMEKHAKRRRMVVAGANDGMIHFFDGGIWDRNRAGIGERYDQIHDLGDGSELFAYVPQAIMPRLYAMTYGTEQQYLVDGPAVVDDAFIDFDGDSSREWRTVAIATMRRGGRGMVALDVTQPDPTSGAPDYVPVVSTLPGCLDGLTAGCDGEFPKVLWEFTDTADSDTNCPSELSGDDCAPYWDLGWTWSKPAIARIAIYNASNENEPDDIFVAFFGGGWDATETDSTGTHFYGINVETGDIIFKYNVGFSLPAGPAVVDTDDDGFHDRVYFADSNGGIWRIQYPDPDSSDATGAEAGGSGDPGIITRIFDFRTDFTDRQMFFQQPVAVSTVVDGYPDALGIALGSGDRANLGDVDDGVNHFFFVIDAGDNVTRGASDLLSVDYTSLADNFDCSTNALDPAGGYFGWYLNLHPNEKLVSRAPVIDGYVVFTTFDPTPGVVATQNPPDGCIPADDPPDGEEEPSPEDPEVVCSASGIGRYYKLWFECGLGEISESDSGFSEVETYTEGNTTSVFAPSLDPDEPGAQDEFEHFGSHVVTNWRQD